MIICLTDMESRDLQRTVFLTNHGVPTKVLRAMLCTASSLDQLVSEISAPHAGPAYVRIVIMYICIVLVFTRIGIVLCLFSIGLSAALILRALVQVSEMCLLNFSLKSSVTPILVSI